MTYNFGYDQSAMIPDDGNGWDRYTNRLSRYGVYNGYYNNVAYYHIQSYAQALKYYEKLYKHVRGVYNPVYRLVELYVSKMYPGALDLDEAITGAVPIRSATDELRMALIRLWEWSDWSQKKALYIRDGVRFGDSFIKIIDNTTARRVRLEVVDPRKIKHIEKDDAGDIVYAVIEYRRQPPGRPDAPSELYTETITQESFSTQLDGKPAAVHTNGQGDGVQEWANDYGFVPLVHTAHRDIGLAFGAVPYSATLHKINELNDFASIVNDGGRRQVQMPLVSTGVRGDVTIGADQSRNPTDTSDTPKKDEVAIINLPGKDATLTSIAPSINLADAAVIINMILEELERDNPELTLHRIRQGGNLTAPGIRGAYDDGASRIIDARTSYDSGLVRAHKMAVAIAGFRGYDGFEDYALESRDNDDTKHNIGDRPIIGDTLAKNEKISLTIQAAGSPAAEVVLEEMGYSKDAIDRVTGAADEQAQAADLAGDLLTIGAPIDNNPPNPETAITEQDINEARQMV